MSRTWTLTAALVAAACGACDCSAGGGADPDAEGGVVHDAPGPDNDAPDAPGIVLQPRCQAILDAVNASADSHHAPGGGFALVLEGELVCVVPHGTSMSEEPVTEDTLFRWGWPSSFVTALAALELASAGEIDLDATLPESLIAGFQPAEWAAEIRVRDLIWQVSGLPYEGLRTQFVPGCSADGPDATELLNEFDVANRVMLDRPGRLAHPTLIGDVLLGLTLETFTGRPLAELVRERVYTPLGMDDSYFGWSDDLAARGVVGYTKPNAGVVTLVTQPLQGCPAADARLGVTTSLRDAARLLEVLARGGVRAGGDRVFAEATMEALFEPRFPSWWGGTLLRMAPGGWLIDEPAPLYNSGGYGAGNGVDLAFAQGTGFGVIAFSNVNWWEAQRAALSAGVSAEGYAYPMPDGDIPEVWEPTPDALSEYEGTYCAPMAGVRATIELGSDGVLRASLGGAGLPLHPVVADVFRTGGSNRTPKVFFLRTGGEIDLAKVDDLHLDYAFYPEGHVPAEISALSSTGCP